MAHARPRVPPRPLHEPRPRPPRPSTTGFRPVTRSPSNAATLLAAASLAAAVPTASAFRAASLASLYLASQA
eukprot:CAMPEP_0185531108 /NCGR_PEP_ID=MMETSP1366-20130426/105742_1 /TAXON_ID=38817 /ORGANISM="Gephyrocapsa oceanica, Strain RCC1303" /LENGTH=71 /DNA_ID=CAMNT_0028142805 /DNA_START=29 /DNA_END=241 /DNA_ORIENTATION=+